MMDGAAQVPEHIVFLIHRRLPVRPPAPQSALRWTVECRDSADGCSAYAPPDVCSSSSPLRWARQIGFRPSAVRGNGGAIHNPRATSRPSDSGAAALPIGRFNFRAATSLARTANRGPCAPGAAPGPPFCELGRALAIGALISPEIGATAATSSGRLRNAPPTEICRVLVPSRARVRRKRTAPAVASATAMVVMTTLRSRRNGGGIAHEYTRSAGCRTQCANAQHECADQLAAAGLSP